MPVIWLFCGTALLVIAQRWLISRLWAKGLRVRLAFSERSVTAGEDVAIDEYIDNRKPLPLPLLRLRYGLCRNFEQLRAVKTRSLPISFRLAVPALRSVRNRTVLPGLARGIYTVSDGELSTQDLFYTKRMTLPFSSHTRLTVYPAKLDERTLSLPYRRLLGAVLTRRPAQEDPFEIRSIRPYEIYDSMRLINWKASAKTGELKVNQHDHTTDEALLLLLDVEHGSAAQRETAISLASTLSSLFLRRGVSVALCANGRSCIGGQEIRVPAGGGSSHLRAIDDSLAQIKLSAEPLLPFEAYLARMAERRRPSALPVVISAGASEPLCAAFDALCGAEGGYFLSLGDEPPAGRRFTVLPFCEESGVAS